MTAFQHNKIVVFVLLQLKKNQKENCESQDETDSVVIISAKLSPYVNIALQLSCAYIFLQEEERRKKFSKD